MGAPFTSVLIANRGEIAVRVERACLELGLRPVLIASEADRAGRARPDEGGPLAIGPSAPSRSYLNQAAILLAARVTGAEAVHPGYGFLSENADFAEAVEAAGLTFVGPPASAIRIMGDKIAAKRAMMAAGVPCVPGPGEPLPERVETVRAIAGEIGYPVIIKAAGGGGGRGMRVVRESAEVADAVAITREEARRAFGRPELYMEKFLEHPRHVEFQVLCDNHGNAVWVGHRDCSVQRRHQKVVEEAPAPGIAPELAERIGARCAEACRQIGYRGVGTFEFLYENGEFYFIEMNTRLQVEHPVTEMTAGVDLVHEQLRVAQGAVLEASRFAGTARGHAFECRVNAEDPETFLAAPGRITAVRFPSGPGIRVDTHVSAGYRVSPYYDSLIAKVIVHAPTREDAVRRMQMALSQTRIEGIATNLPLHERIFADPDFVRGCVDIHHLEKRLREEPRGEA
ncbi:acetyl-CoA carboxylase biotin carboxylase subunit [Shinella yambaruensis]|uniref:biotin carboxylase n=1 Tax=Shinella yambaruensis TaxID=415996 RepID=A0ABQ5ZG61_9HYPH|nr:acetyl-CoA carboxylase biotin carboxylase subunit [Shinella yambaruensis]MCJ8024742.1 acetyl-CoA carboxylase biotin carboxylase subunit [Shinella yambaruensis]MCU7979195.1 acetyl-CoA carboxylase biotin carboxylase subunit [Shinella yambaruensis]GLR51021.1 acetyl-CoA carboxylase biotin carboxylase subunit [Shinella yambaruensis]